MFADFFPPSTKSSVTDTPRGDTGVAPTASRKIPSLNQEAETEPAPPPAEKYDENVFDDSEALEALANTMVVREKPTRVSDYTF